MATATRLATSFVEGTDGRLKAAVRGFDVPCPMCGRRECVAVRLDDLGVFTCSECSEEFTAGDVRKLMAEWTAALAWLDACPARIV